MDDTIDTVRRLLATGDGWALFDEDLAQAIASADRLTATEIVEVHKLSAQRANLAIQNAEITAKLLTQLRIDHVQFIVMARDLVASIEAEETRVGCTDPAHFAYPAFCTDGRIRLNALHRWIDDVVTQIADLEERVGTGGLRMAGQDGIPIERELDGSGVETVFVDGQWRTPA